MEQLLLRHEMVDLSICTLCELHTIEEGVVFIDRGQLCLNSNINGNPLRISWSDRVAPVASDTRSRIPSGYRHVIAMRQSRLVARPLCAPVVVDDKVNLSGSMIVTLDGPAVCAVFAEDNATDEPGRICVNLVNGRTTFHDRQSPIAYEQWEVLWVNEHDETIMSLTRRK